LATRSVVWLFSAGILLLGVGAAFAQGYPNKPIRIINCAPGCSTDLPSRLIAQALSTSLGQPVIVDNRGGGIIPMETAAHSPPDGYSLLYQGATVWILPFLQKIPYDPIRDFAPITLAVAAYNILVVSPSLPVKSVPELIALAKSKPGKLNYAGSTVGASNQLAAELFKYMTGTNITPVYYRGGEAASAAAVAGGEVDLGFINTGVVAQYIKSGQLRALGVTSAERSPLFPDLPTIAGSAPELSGYTAGTRQGVLAPAGTPPAIINRLNQEIVAFLRTDEAKKKFSDLGFEIIADTPEEFATEIRFDMERMEKLAKATGIEPK